MNREHHWELCQKKIKPLHAVPHLAATLRILVLLPLVWEIAPFHIIYVVLEGLQHLIPERRVTTEKAGREFLGNAQHIMRYQHLPIHAAARPGIRSLRATSCPSFAGIFSSTMAKQPSASNSWASSTSLSASSSSVARTT